MRVTGQMPSMNKHMQTTSESQHRLCGAYKKMWYNRYMKVLLNRTKLQCAVNCFISAIFPKIGRSRRISSSCTVLTLQPLPFFSADLYIAFTTKPPYKSRITCGLVITAMHNNLCLYDTRADVNLVKVLLI